MWVFVWRKKEDVLSWWTERYHRKKEKGLCVVCGEKAVEGKTRCKFCSDKAKLLWRDSIARERQDELNSICRNRYHERKEKGLCVRRGKSARENRSMCEACAKKHSEQAKKKQEAEYEK